MSSFCELKEQGVTSLKVGAPDDTLLKACFDIVSMATKALYDSGEVTCLQYAPNLGDQQYLEQLAKLLTDELQDEVKVENLMVNAGAAQGLMFILSMLFTKGDIAVIEDPTYFLALQGFRENSGMTVFSVSSCDDGVDVDQLDEVLSKNIDKEKMTSEGRRYHALVYLIPTFNNPCGTCLSEEKSTKLVQVLRKHKALAVCDDVYNLVYFMDDNPPFTTLSPKRLFAYDKESDPDYQGNVISNGSFSKIMGPGLRLGWIEAPKHLISTFKKSAFLTSGGAFNQYTACVIREAMKLGLIPKHLTLIREEYYKRMNALCDAIDKHLPMAKYTRPKGGYFVWVRFPENIDAVEFGNYCLAKYKVTAPAGVQFSCTSSFKNYMRMSFAHYTEDILAQCIEKFGLAIKEFVNHL